MNFLEFFGFSSSTPAEPKPNIVNELKQARGDLAGICGAFERCDNPADIESCIYEMKALECRIAALHQAAKLEASQNSSSLESFSSKRTPAALPATSSISSPHFSVIYARLPFLRKGVK